MPPADTEQPNFSDFLTSEEPSEPSSPDAQPEANQSLATPQEAQEALSQTETPAVEPESEVRSQEPVAPSAEERLTFEGYLRNNSFEIDDDVDPEDLYQRTVAEIQFAAQSRDEIARLKEQLAQAQQLASQPAPSVSPASPATPAPVDPQPEAPAAPTTVFQELQDYDPSLRNYVEIDERGRAIPKTEYGQAAVEAASQINAYETAAARQAELLMKNPSALIQDHMGQIERIAEEKARALLEERFSSYQEEQNKQLEEQRKQAAQAEYDSKVNAWHESHKAKVFKIGPDGEPRVDPFDPNAYAFTPLGKVFQAEYAELAQRYSSLDRLDLMQLAMDRAELKAPAAEPVQTQTPQTQLQQKQQFVEQRQTQTVPNQSHTPAPIEEVAQAFPNLSFADMIRSDPENQDTISRW